jgi:hypothetical protein
MPRQQTLRYRFKGVFVTVTQPVERILELLVNSPDGTASYRQIAAAIWPDLNNQPRHNNSIASMMWKYRQLTNAALREAGYCVERFGELQPCLRLQKAAGATLSDADGVHGSLYQSKHLRRKSAANHRG